MCSSRKNPSRNSWGGGGGKKKNLLGGGGGVFFENKITFFFLIDFKKCGIDKTRLGGLFGGGGGCKTETFCGESMDIFLNYTIHSCFSMNLKNRNEKLIALVLLKFAFTLCLLQVNFSDSIKNQLNRLHVYHLEIV